MSEPSDRTFHRKADERELKMHLLAGIVMGVYQGCHLCKGNDKSWVDIYAAHKKLSAMLRDVQDDKIAAVDFQKLWEV